MGASQNWYKYVGLDGAVLGIDTFGASAPAPKVLAEYGFTVENLVKVVQNLNNPKNQGASSGFSC